MPLEKATALVVRTVDWSDTSRIATLWTREFGRVRVLAKGARRLKSNFDTALDLLSVSSIVLLRKSSGTLDLLTEAQVVKRFPRLRADLQALYAAYYVAELLAEWTEDYDPHPGLFNEAIAALEDLGAGGGAESAPSAGIRLARFELVLLRELGYSPVLSRCVTCENELDLGKLAFGLAVGGMLCPNCQQGQRHRRPVSMQAWKALQALDESQDAWQNTWAAGVRNEIRRLLGDYITYLMGKPPRLLAYLGT